LYAITPHNSQFSSSEKPTVRHQQSSGYTEEDETPTSALTDGYYANHGSGSTYGTGRSSSPYKARVTSTRFSAQGLGTVGGMAGHGNSPYQTIGEN
jgi:hypothetical protein